jgi:hypothetical protein
MVSLTGAVVFNRVAKYIQIYQLKINAKEKKNFLLNKTKKLLDIEYFYFYLYLYLYLYSIE